MQKICDTYRDYGILLPEYMIHSEDIMLKLTALEEAVLNIPKHLPKHQEDVLETRILEVFKIDDKIKQNELVKQLDVSIASVQRIMKKMVENGKIERRGGKRHGYREIRE